MADETSEQNRQLIAQVEQTAAAQTGIRKLGVIAMILVSAATVISLVIAVTFIHKGDTNDARASAQIADLHQQLSTSQATTAQFRADQSDKALCLARYDDAIEASTATYLSSLGDDVVILSTEADATLRLSKLIAQAKVIADANDASRKAVNARIGYNAAGQPLPCPLAPPAQTPAPTTTLPG